MGRTIDPAERAPRIVTGAHDGPVTLINRFVVPAGRDDAFLALWTETSEYFRAQPGFRSLRFHRALSPDTGHRFVNIATWASVEEFQAAHQTPEFFRLVGRPEWSEFSNDPALYDVIAEYAVEAAELC
jgi:heme-degrading monooxygenase HmoA